MAKPKVKLVKKGAMKAAAKASAAGPVVDFVLQDNQNDTVTILGADAAGNPVDISSVATLTAVSSDPTKVTVSTPSGMTATETAVGPLTVAGSPVAVSFTATWNDGSLGPFTVVDSVDVVNSPAGGVVIQHGTPTVS